MDIVPRHWIIAQSDRGAETSGTRIRANLSIFEICTLMIVQTRRIAPQIEAVRTDPTLIVLLPYIYLGYFGRFGCIFMTPQAPRALQTVNRNGPGLYGANQGGRAAWATKSLQRSSTIHREVSMCELGIITLLPSFTMSHGMEEIQLMKSHFG
jgi:hypothetical protein